MKGRSRKEWRKLTKNWGATQRELVIAAREAPLEERTDRARKCYEIAARTQDEDQKALWHWSSLMWNLTDSELDLVIGTFNK